MSAELEVEPAPCVVCDRPLRVGEARACDRCVQRTRDALITIRDAKLEPIIEATALHPGELPGGRALVMAADGNMSALRPYKPEPAKPSKPVFHPTIPGSQREVTYRRRDEHGVSQQYVMVEDMSHPPYIDARPPADGREHYADHWSSDPLVPAPLLESIARAWRIAFREPVSDEIRDVQGDCDYLLRHLNRAVADAPDFDTDAPDLWRLAQQLANTTGAVNYPEIAPARCFDCNDFLISPYREPVRRDHSGYLRAVAEQRQAEDTYGLAPTEIMLTSVGMSFEGREMAQTDDATPMPIWQCANRDCARVYQPAEYWLAVHAALLAEAEKAG